MHMRQKRDGSTTATTKGRWQLAQRPFVDSTSL